MSPEGKTNYWDGYVLIARARLDNNQFTQKIFKAWRIFVPNEARVFVDIIVSL